ncbi:MAG: CpsD/CapB family tyrosine-protein kinase [Roseburia sp.]|nr:CpsD/CapB family tyrosine-protein kinase [Roseburia sp.]
MNSIHVEFQEMPYAIEEAMNRLRINIKFCGKSTRKILLTSSMPNEGKSTIAANLWKMMAEAGFPTVLVDVDLRKSVMKERHRMLVSEDHKKDLGYYLSGLAEYEDVVYETNVKNGYLVPCVNLLENPSMLLEDVRFRELLDRLSREYRYVIIDSPPLGSVADAALVASMCDGAVLVVRSGETSRSLIRQSFQQIEQVHCKLLGVILNRVQTGGHAYKKYYGKYGKYYKDYGYGYYGKNRTEVG